MSIEWIRELQLQLRVLYKQSRRNLPPVEGVSWSGVRVLGIVARSGSGGVWPVQIAGDLEMKSPNVAAALRELEAHDYVSRRRDPADGRRTVVVLTRAGERVVQAHRALRADGLREAVELVLTPDEQRQLAAVVPLLERVAAAGTWDGTRV